MPLNEGPFPIILLARIVYSDSCRNLIQDLFILLSVGLQPPPPPKHQCV